MTDGLRYTVDGTVARLVLDRPDRLNAIDVRLVERLHAALAEVREQPAVTALTLTGAGRAFCAGSDVQDMERRPARHALRGQELAAARTAERTRLARAFDVAVQLAELPRLTVAGLHGSVAGAGIGLALACDVRIAARSTVFVPAFGAIGLPGDWGVTRLLQHKAGDAVARRMLLAGERLGADEALRVGLVDEVVPDEELTEAVDRRAAAVAGASVTALGEAKALLPVPGLRDAVREEIEATLRCQETDAHAEALRALRARSTKGQTNA
jgi:enoyl-CoA hydratase/carnithine racemase